MANQSTLTRTVWTITAQGYTFNIMADTWTYRDGLDDFVRFTRDGHVVAAVKADQIVAMTASSVP